MSEAKIGTFTVRLIGDGSLEVRTELHEAYVLITDGIFDGVRVYDGRSTARHDQVTLHQPGGLRPGAHFA